MCVCKQMLIIQIFRMSLSMLQESLEDENYKNENHSAIGE